MAFTQDTFATVGAQSTDTPTIYSYRTDDSITEVLTVGYFTDKKEQFEQGDIILAQTANGFFILEILLDTSTAIIADSDASDPVLEPPSDYDADGTESDVLFKSAQTFNVANTMYRSTHVTATNGNVTIAYTGLMNGSPSPYTLISGNSVRITQYSGGYWRT